MGRSNANRFGPLRPSRLGIVLLASASLIGWGHTAGAQTKTVAPLAANDVSWLFPAPVKSTDVSALISISDVTAPDPQDNTKRAKVWSDEVFAKFIGIAEAEPGLVEGTTDRIVLPPEAKTMSAWKIAGIRIDPGAPGVGAKIIDQFGQSAQIRLILQPVVAKANAAPQPLDFAAHLIFSVAQAPPKAPAENGCFARPQVDNEALKALIADVASLRTKLAAGELGKAKVSTSGVLLGVHPGLRNAATAAALGQEMKSFLERHISAQQLGSMAIMGLPAPKPAPWIFLSMLNVQQLGGFIPVHGPTLDGKQFSEMLTPVGQSPRVVPAPHTNNQAEITCQHAALLQAPLPVAGRHGVATADLFDGPAMSGTGKKAVLDLIVDPDKSHFFNTDCVSCHTSTQLRIERFGAASVTGVSQAALPPGPWTVRAFGWSPLIDGPSRGVVAERTARETASVVNFINATLLPDK